MENWKHLGPNAMATNTDPIYGGIIDSEIVSGLWFVIFNNDDFVMLDGFASKADAFAAWEKVVTSA